MCVAKKNQVVVDGLFEGVAASYVECIAGECGERGGEWLLEAGVTRLVASIDD
ncbi:hypothetical protein D3C76_960020 [compost metagenome]